MVVFCKITDVIHDSHTVILLGAVWEKTEEPITAFLI
jgi:hypothetical protein